MRSSDWGGRIVIGRDVARAIDANAAVVALETTVLTHGLPRPLGVTVALDLEAVVRAAGATPATIGVLDGAIKVGLTPAEIERLAVATDVVKVNPCNLAATITTGRLGSTTVAATMVAAHACGIRVFATGGIGGVHREVVDTGDVSADLTILGRVPVAVVCAGAKAVLDLPRTLEMLETLGVPVLGFGTGELPAFYRRSSGLAIDARFDGADALAAAIRTHFDIGLSTGVLVVNPIPAEDELPEALYERALQTALADAAAQRVRGRAVTPFLLDRLRAVTGGESVRANSALLRHNAKVAAELSRALVAADGP
jgi:pseudouridine-5'-phosphate glycosidase